MFFILFILPVFAFQIQSLGDAVTFSLSKDGLLIRDDENGRKAVDANVKAFQAIDRDNVFILGTDGNLWRSVVTGQVPPPRIQVDATVRSFQALSLDVVFVLGNDRKLWRTSSVNGVVPPPRVQVDATVKTFQAMNSEVIFVLGTDSNLWRTRKVTGKAPPPRIQVDAEVHSFQAVNHVNVYVLGHNGNLWRVDAINGKVPPPRTQVDATVDKFQPLNSDIAFVLGRDGNLWRSQVTGAVPPPRVQVDTTVDNFYVAGMETVFIKGTDSKVFKTLSITGKVPPPREALGPPYISGWAQRDIYQEGEVLDGYGLFAEMKWAIVSDKPFHYQTRGVRITKGPLGIPLPTPFNGNWNEARKDYPFPGLYGTSGTDAPLPTFFVHVRVSGVQSFYSSVQWDASKLKPKFKF